MKNQPAVPEQGQNKTFLYLMLGFTAFFVLSFIVIVFFIHSIVSKANGGETALFSGSGDGIDLIEIEGAITDSDDVVKRIRRFKKSSEKALIIRLNSPGGAVAPSQEIYYEILSARQDKKIVVASMSSLAASGAYYIAAACDKIVADPGTLTGSIGVIAEFPEASGLFKKVGVNFQTIKSGKLKDTGSFSRPMNEEDRAYLQDTVNDVYHQFLDAVIDGRRQAFKDKLAVILKVKADKINDEQIKNYILPYADGRAVTGKKAFELGMVDQLGNYDDAVQLTATLAGIKGEPNVHPDKSGKFDQLLDSVLPFSLFSQLRQYGNSSFQLEYKAF
ncbi:MAG TPA: signal peptide peptidase SppA [bacterium]|nr:signal peptide peptidase SppA [bacterium]